MAATSVFNSPYSFEKKVHVRYVFIICEIAYASLMLLSVLAMPIGPILTFEKGHEIHRVFSILKYFPRSNIFELRNSFIGEHLNYRVPQIPFNPLTMMFFGSPF